MLICTWTINYAFDSEMHKAPFVCNFSKVHVEKLNHPSHLNDAHYSVVVFFSRQLVISLPVFGAGEEKEDRKESPWGGALLVHMCKLYDFPERSLDLW